MARDIGTVGRDLEFQLSRIRNHGLDQSSGHALTAAIGWHESVFRMADPPAVGPAQLTLPRTI